MSNEITVKASVDSLSHVLQFVDSQLEAVDCPPKAQIQMDVAVEELFVNIASYAYPGSEGDATIRFFTEDESRTAAVTFIDSGVPYDPLRKEDPDISLSAEQRQIGGLGIYMVKKSMDRIEYRYEDGRNILTIKKHL